MDLVELPVISLGEYEEISKPYIFAKKMRTQKYKYWIVLKYEGCGIMISALQYREFGFGYPLTVPDLQKINEYCDLQPKYVDTEAATTILGHTHKEPITMGRNTFFRDFEYGTSAEVYWAYERMVLQIEDCTNTRGSSSQYLSHLSI